MHLTYSMRIWLIFYKGLSQLLGSSSQICLSKGIVDLILSKYLDKEETNSGPKFICEIGAC